jgi:hypothetical protein
MMEAAIGLVVLVLALSVHAAFVIWSVRAINRIGEGRLRSARDIVKELNRER